ncbi:MAG: epoxyqueuosine reductase QueH [Butyrivibrio sp.]|nr:epoxyqueuosine reductase QueH [Butyrivibrio sp.]
MNKVNYAKELEKKIQQFQKEGRYPKLLLHACCAPCSSYSLEYLRQYFDITVFFYNPNIMNEPEYVKRVEEEKRLIAEYNRQVEEGNFEGMHSDASARKIEIIEGVHNVADFLKAVKGLEKCPEGGDRCTKCFELRLEESAKIAKEHGFEFFTTTLTISPLKDAERLNRIGSEMGDKYGVSFLPSDFKKKEGYKRSIELSHMFDLYRQDFCGCEFSRQERLSQTQNIQKSDVDISVIGAAVMDVLAGPVNPGVFDIGSIPMEFIRTSFGGDALNEAVVLSRLGKKTELITRLGTDEAGDRTKVFLNENGVSTERSAISDEFPSSVNIVLVDEKGERFFLTDPKSCLRKLSEEDILAHADSLGGIVSFASIFVSPVLGIPAMERVFKAIKNGSDFKRTLLTDMTKPKKGEKLSDIACFLPYIDYYLANEDEIAMLTDCRDAKENAGKVVAAGAGCAVIKRGSKGCLIKTADKCYEIPAYPDCKVIDSTGAGDSFAAGFLYGLSEGYSLDDCGRFACAVASCAVEKVGGSEGIDSADEPLKRYKVLKGMSHE